MSQARRGFKASQQQKNGLIGGKADFNSNPKPAYYLTSDNLNDKSGRHIWGLTPDNLQDWNKWGTFFKYSTIAFLSIAAFTWATGFIFASYPITDPDNTPIRVFAMVALHLLLILSPMGELVTGAMNPFVCILIELVHVTFITYLNLLRIPWMIIASFFAAAMGVICLAMWPGFGGFHTSDCTLDKILACDAQPFMNNVNNGPAYVAIIIATLIECFIFLGPVWKLNYENTTSCSDEKSHVLMRRQYVTWAAIYALFGYTLIHTMITPYVGYTFHVFNWLWLGIVTGDFSNAVANVVMPLVGVIIGFVLFAMSELFRMYQT